MVSGYNSLSVVTHGPTVSEGSLGGHSTRRATAAGQMPFEGDTPIPLE